MKGRGRPKKGCAKKLNFNKVIFLTLVYRIDLILHIMRPWMDLVVHITIVQNVYSQEISRVEKS